MNSSSENPPEYLPLNDLDKRKESNLRTEGGEREEKGEKFVSKDR